MIKEKDDIERFVFSARAIKAEVWSMATSPTLKDPERFTAFLDLWYSVPFQQALRIAGMRHLEFLSGEIGVIRGRDCIAAEATKADNIQALQIFSNRGLDLWDFVTYDDTFRTAFDYARSAEADEIILAARNIDRHELPSRKALSAARSEFCRTRLPMDDNDDRQQVCGAALLFVERSGLMPRANLGKSVEPAPQVSCIDPV